MDRDDILVIFDFVDNDELLEEVLSNGLFDPRLADNAPVSAVGSFERLMLLPSQVFVSFCFDGVAVVVGTIEDEMQSSLSFILASSLERDFVDTEESVPTSLSFLFGFPNSH